MFARGEYDTYPGAEQMMAWLLGDALLTLRLDACGLLGKPADWLDHRLLRGAELQGYIRRQRRDGEGQSAVADFNVFDPLERALPSLPPLELVRPFAEPQDGERNW
jgi:hypothetical protein